jgi:trans-2,3-dihydro-3-hydroxyanthranilate isomerase
MGRLTFYIVDVFAEEKYAGNQLAVFRSGNALADIDMQRIAKEMNFSETTFILSETRHEGGFDVRIFTPLREVPFAGHPRWEQPTLFEERLFLRVRERSF